jgi:hypothetical protein
MATATTTLILIAITIVAGILGGIVNYYQSASVTDAIKSWFYYVLLSICAAFIVPLFLSLAKSQILSSIFADKLSLEDWFVFFGACVLAAVFAKNFLETVSQRFLKMAEDAKNAADNAQDTAQKTAHDVSTSLNKLDAASEKIENQADEGTRRAMAPREPGPPPDFSAYSPQEQAILKALTNPAFALGRRSLGGIATETKLDRPTVTSLLDKLVAAGVVKEATGDKAGNQFYEFVHP